MLFFIMTVWIVLAFCVFVLMVLKGWVLRDQAYNLAFSKYGRFTSIPLLFTCGIVLIPLAWKEEHPADHSKKWYKEFRNCFIVGLVFCIFALAGFIVIYILMPKCNSIIAFVFKKGFISWSIACLIWYFIDCCFEANLYNYEYQILDYGEKILTGFEERSPPEIHPKARKRAGYACMVLYGVLIGVLGFLFKDVVMPVCGMFLLMGQMVVSAKAKKKPDGYKFLGYLDDPGFRRKGNWWPWNFYGKNNYD